MKTDGLRRALTDLSGDDPDVDDAFRGVTGRARTQRNHFRLGLAAACAVVIAGAAVAGVQLRSNPHQLTVTNPAPVASNVSDFTWSRIAAPFSVNRITTANGQSFVLGSSVDENGTAAIAAIDGDHIAASVDPATNHLLVLKLGSANDLVGVPGALIAVGRMGGVAGSVPDAWRSTDGGQTWQDVPIEVPGGNAANTINRIVTVKGAVYAVGMSPCTVKTCSSSIWTSNDGMELRPASIPITLAGPADIASGPAGLLITSADNTIAWTQNGDKWSPHRITADTPDPSARVTAVAGSDSGYVAVGSTRDITSSPKDSGGAIWWSSDGAAWTQVATAQSPTDPKYIQAEFTGVAHSASGWIAVGWQLHPGGDPTSTDAIVWTSPDGQHWTPDTQDRGVFEQYQRADGVGPTTDGFAIFGEGNITGTGTPLNPIRQDDVLWLGSATPPTAPTGILEGTMEEVGGPTPVLRAVAGSAIVTTPDGHETTLPVEAGGRFSANFAPGTYKVVGHSPQYGDGKYDCDSWLDGSDMAGDPIIVKSQRVTHLRLQCQLK